MTRPRTKEDALHPALRMEGIFLLQNVSHTQREGQNGRATRGAASFHLNVSKKKKNGEKLIKYIFLKLKCKYPHLQELEC